MEVRATKHQIDAVERVIRSSPAIRRVRIRRQAQGVRGVQADLQEQAEARAVEFRPSDLPVSFRVDTSSTAAADEFQRQAEDLDGVDSAPLMYRPSVAETLTTVRLCRQRGASFEVFMRVGASEQQLAVDARHHERVAGRHGRTCGRNTDDALVEFTKVLASQPDKLEGMRPEDLPMSIRFEGPKAADSMDRFRALEASSRSRRPTRSAPKSSAFSPKARPRSKSPRGDRAGVGRTYLSEPLA